ncbi:MAG: hypothetical protein JO212_00055, partial [Acetobacteraceae bacterium]|nr:hypothetical protein [Acetobacteraceae bacterium]
LSQFDDLAAALDHDPFAIHAELATMGAAFPAEYRATMATALAMSGTEAVREAALGFAFSSDAAVSTAAISALAKHAHEAMASNATIERLVRMRPWFSAARQADVDAAIRALRAKAAPPKASQRPEIRSVAASLCDGAGAQSLFALAKRGRRFAMAAVLVKTDAGVADAWVRDDMNSRAEADALIEEILAQTEAVEISIGLFERRLAAALETNVARDAPPPFGLLQVAEMLGLGALYPEPVSPSAIVDTLLAELPAERTNPAAEVAAHQVSMTWDEEFSTVDSWFEAGQAVESLLRPLKTRKRRIEAVLTDLLPGRRSFWAERCAWMAATLKDGAEEGDEAWIDFALVARDLAGERPLATIPIASRIAEATVDAFRQR